MDDLTEIVLLDPTSTERPQPMTLPSGAPQGVFTTTSAPGVDAIAAYLPWHFFRDAWGIYVYQQAFFGFSRDLADLASESPTTIAPIAFRQILFHEWTHFAFEIVATELEDALKRPLYRDYSLLEVLVRNFLEHRAARRGRCGVAGDSLPRRTPTQGMDAAKAT